MTAKCQRCIKKLDALKRQIEEAKAKGPTMPQPGEISEHNRASGIHVLNIILINEL